MLWADMPSHNMTGSNIGSQMSAIENQFNYIMNINASFMKMYDYFDLFAKANDMVVTDDAESADVVIDNSLIQNTEEFAKKATLLILKREWEKVYYRELYS